MIIIEKTLGNVSDPLWHDRSHRGQVDPLVLEHWEAPKSRLRKASEGGLELAISLPRSEHLHDGDVLYYDAAKDYLVVARVPLKDVLVIELNGLEGLPPVDIVRICFELGHGLGNQHWPAVIKGSTIYVPLSVDQKVMASVMRTHAFAHVTSRFAPGAEIADKLTAKEMRLLFAGADATPHHHHGDHHHGDHDHHHAPAGTK
ncbi:urease accessory protein UreE [Xanthobacter sp. V4C-4]|uniref:urease accessory protein UreE n=1 Tax=Xanthobacter cornucopiae TaxID=3119924 RepID=UPI003727C64D